MAKATMFKVFPSYSQVEICTEAGVTVTIKGEGEARLLSFEKPLRTLELQKSEALRIAFLLLGRVEICEICGKPFRKLSMNGVRAKARFCSRECFFEWTRRAGGLFKSHSKIPRLDAKIVANAWTEEEDNCLIALWKQKPPLPVDVLTSMFMQKFPNRTRSAIKGRITTLKERRKIESRYAWRQKRKRVICPKCKREGRLFQQKGGVGKYRRKYTSWVVKHAGGGKKFCYIGKTLPSDLKELPKSILQEPKALQVARPQNQVVHTSQVQMLNSLEQSSEINSLINQWQSHSSPFTLFPSNDLIRIYVETCETTGVEVFIRGEGKHRLLHFTKGVREVKLKKLEALKYAFALLGRIAVCETCGQLFRKRRYYYLNKRYQSRFCSRECWKKACKTSGSQSWFMRGIAKMSLVAFHPERLKDTANIVELDSPGELKKLIKWEEATRNLFKSIGLINYKPMFKIRKKRNAKSTRIGKTSKIAKSAPRCIIDGPKIQKLLSVLKKEYGFNLENPRSTTLKEILVSERS